MNEKMRYLQLKESDFNRLTNLFLVDDAVAYIQDGNIFFGTIADLDRVKPEPLFANFVILTQRFTCNIIVEDNLVKLMTINRFEHLEED